MMQLNWHPDDLLALHQSERTRQMEQACVDNMIRRNRRASEVHRTSGLWARALTAVFGVRRAPAEALVPAAPSLRASSPNGYTKASVKPVAPVLTAESGASGCMCTD